MYTKREMATILAALLYWREELAPHGEDHAAVLQSGGAAANQTALGRRDPETFSAAPIKHLEITERQLLCRSASPHITPAQPLRTSCPFGGKSYA